MATGARQGRTPPRRFRMEVESMRPTPSSLALLIGLGVLGAPITLAAEAPPAVPAKSPRSRWDLALFTELSLVPREAGSPRNEPPRELDPEALGRSLGQLRLNTEDGEEPLFDTSELAGLLKPLAEALALATPEQDLLLLSTHRRGGSFLNVPLTLSARIFLKDGALQLILGDTRKDATSYYLAQRMPPSFSYGSRSKASEARLKSSEGTQPRPDWTVLPLAGLLKGTTPAATSRPNSAPAAPPRDARERLQNLKRLREENLITEAEYEAKRTEILKEL